MHMIFYFVISFKANRGGKITLRSKINILAKLRKVIFSFLIIYLRSKFYFLHQTTEKCINERSILSEKRYVPKAAPF